MGAPHLRFTLLGLMAVVATMAIGFGTWVVGPRSIRRAQFYRAKAEEMARVEQVLKGPSGSHRGHDVDTEPEDNGPRLSPWFWDLLESSSRSLKSLARKLEQLPKEQLLSHRDQYEEAKGYIDVGQDKKYWPYMKDHALYSEDGSDDFAAWVVMQGREFYERVRTQAELIQQFLDLHEDDEIGEGDPAYFWENSVEKKEYEGSQRADYIASPIYEMRFGGSLYDDLHNLYYDNGRQLRRDFDARE
jgi:hypothetical protein